MGEIVNLNKFRKAKAKAEKEAEAETNRVRHGRTKAERETQRRTDEHSSRKLDGHRIDPDDDPKQPA
jgi:hypothetical protein